MDNADAKLNEAISDLVDECLDDSRIDPQTELRRIINIVSSSFIDHWNERTQGLERCPECGNRVPIAELQDIDGGAMCESCAEVYREDHQSEEGA